MPDRDDLQARLAAQRRESFSRRHFLRGAGVCLALPVLESLIPRQALADIAEAAAHAGRLATTDTGAPLRTAFVYFPNGAILPNWWPTGTGADFKFNATLQPLEAVRDSIRVLGGLDHLCAVGGVDGAGDHARANSVFLSGVRPKKSATDIHLGISIDQRMAREVGHLTRLASLELTCDDTRKSSACDSDYACAYQYNISWSSPTTPVAAEANPRLAFERLFGTGAPGERVENSRQRLLAQKSVLDFVMEDADGNSLLHNSMIVYGSGDADGNRHTHDNLPILLAGVGGGTLSPASYVNYNSAPACNLFMSLADRMGMQNLARFGDSTGRINI